MHPSCPWQMRSLAKRAVQYLKMLIHATDILIATGRLYQHPAENSRIASVLALQELHAPIEKLLQ